MALELLYIKLTAFLYISQVCWSTWGAELREGNILGLCLNTSEHKTEVVKLM